uniref:Ovule protein n=1 Tax=Steinernema glaseri TaxID=37863 RepID=A0A1I7ZVZ5_9BILA
MSCCPSPLAITLIFDIKLVHKVRKIIVGFLPSLVPFSPTISAFQILLHLPASLITKKMSCCTSQNHVLISLPSAKTFFARQSHGSAYEEAQRSSA